MACCLMFARTAVKVCIFNFDIYISMFTHLLRSTIYSGTSLKGLSQWYHANTFLALKEENLYITAKMTQKWLVPKCPL